MPLLNLPAQAFGRNSMRGGTGSRNGSGASLEAGDGASRRPEIPEDDAVVRFRLSVVVLSQYRFEVDVVVPCGLCKSIGANFVCRRGAEPEIVERRELNVRM